MSGRRIKQHVPAPEYGIVLLEHNEYNEFAKKPCYACGERFLLQPWGWWILWWEACGSPTGRWCCYECAKKYLT